MHIIKISPQSFKIVLSKDDLKRHGVENILHHADMSGDFFEEIIRETNRIYGSPFAEGAIDAEFFESKDGGGELFICSSKSSHKSITYLFRTDNCESLIKLCKRLMLSNPPCDSRLFHQDGRYSMLLFYQSRDSILIPVMKEFGTASEISKIQIWLLEEHESVIIDKDAIHTVAESF